MPASVLEPSYGIYPANAAEAQELAEARAREEAAAQTAQ